MQSFSKVFKAKESTITKNGRTNLTPYISSVAITLMLFAFFGGMSRVDAAAQASLGKENVRTLMPDTDIFFSLFSSKALDVLRPITVFISPALRFALEVAAAAVRLFA